MSSQPQSKLGLHVSSLPAQMKGVSQREGCIRVTSVWEKPFIFNWHLKLMPERQTLLDLSKKKYYDLLNRGGAGVAVSVVVE